MITSGKTAYDLHREQHKTRLRPREMSEKSGRLPLGKERGPSTKVWAERAQVKMERPKQSLGYSTFTCKPLSGYSNVTGKGEGKLRDGKKKPLNFVYT